MKVYQYVISNTHKKGCIKARSMDDLRKKAFVILGSGEEMWISAAKTVPPYEASDAINIKNSYWGKYDTVYGEQWTIRGGMRAVYKKSGKIGHKTGL